MPRKIRTINILSGVPGSGKSTYVKAKRAIVCSRDAFRTNLRDELGTDEYFPVSAKEEWELWSAHVEGMIWNTKEDIFIDQTTVGHGALIKILGVVSKVMREDDRVIIHQLDKPLALCLRRNADRTDYEKVPEGTIKGMHKRLRMEPFTLENVRIIAEDAGIANTKISVKVVK